MTTTTVTVKQGTLKGAVGESFKGDRFVQFLGIPYAKPPVGELRFKAPEPAEPWVGVRDATKDGSCAPSFDTINQKVVGGDDCLFLNVFTRNLPKDNATKSNLKPVMVNIHGGAFTMASSSTELAGPEIIMQKDIVLVTLNYRLGLFGFLSLEDDSLDVPGNAGLKDQVLALKWVRENIRSFGGDPDNVTIFGISAGGASVHLLYLSPTTKGLFHKAIAMSGSALNPWVRGSRNVKEVAKLLGKRAKTEKEALSVLMTATVEELVQAQVKIPDEFWNATKPRPFCPIIEHPNPTAFMTKEPREIIECGEYNQVPFMTGITSKEGYILGMFPDRPKGDLTECLVPRDMGLNNVLSKLAAQKLREKYMDVEDGVYDLASDVLFVNGILETVATQKKTSSQPIYLYLNSMETKLGVFKAIFGFADKPGVAHADDTPHLFNMKGIPRDCEPGSREELATERLLGLLVNFAESGDPTPGREFGVDWTPVSGPDHLDYLDFADDLTMKVDPFADRMAFWKWLYDAKKHHLIE